MGRFDGRSVAAGYMLDHEKHSESYERYLIYPPHVELVLTSAMDQGKAEGALWQTYGWHYGVKVLNVEPAIEAPGLDEVPTDRQVNLTPHRPQSDACRWLVWWE